MQFANVICSKCGTSNEPQTSYCVRCGNALFNQPYNQPVYTNHPSVPLVPPVQTHYGTFPPQSVSPMPQQVSPIYVQPVTPRSRSHTTRNIIITSCIGVGLLLLLFIGTIVFTTQATNSVPTYPTLVSSYVGTVHNNTVNISSSLSLTSVTEDSQGNISGSAFVGRPLVGSGPFTGTIGIDRTIQFTVTPNDNAGVSTIHFDGMVQANGSMSGTYTVSGTGETGTWKVKTS